MHFYYTNWTNINQALLSIVDKCGSNYSIDKVPWTNGLLLRQQIIYLFWGKGKGSLRFKFTQQNNIKINNFDE